MGVLISFEVPSELQMVLLLVLFYFVCASIVSIMEDRYYILFAGDSCWAKIRVPVLVTNFIVLLLGYLSVFLFIPEQKSARELARGKYPQVPKSVYSELLIVSVDISTLIPVIICGFIIVFEVEVLCHLIVRNMRKQSKSVSKKTYELRKKFLIAIVIQISAPLIILACPALYTEISLLFGYYSQDLNNIFTILASTHGWVSTVIMVFIHEPYRIFVISRLRAKFCKILIE